MLYAVVTEKAQADCSAYLPDLPGRVATGATVEETEREIQAAIRFHLDGLRADSLTMPEPSTLCEYVRA